jgi:RimJ/RimL family protein N-acetyltransferase
MMSKAIPILVGELVKLRPLNYDNDHLSWFEIEQDENIHIWVGNTVPKSIEEVKNYLYELYPKHFLIWMIEEKVNQNVIGMMRISHPEYQVNQLVAGDSQRLHSDYWRQGYMKESRKLVYDYVFNEMKVDVLYADVWEGNISSSKSLEAAGYKLIDVKKEYFKKYNRIQNKLYYQLESNVWNELRKK